METSGPIWAQKTDKVNHQTSKKGENNQHQTDCRRNGGDPGPGNQIQDEKTILNVVYLNARSLCSKLNELQTLAADKEPDLILICETWCNKNIQNSLLEIENYYIEPNLRFDRCDTVNGIGGGVIIYARNGLVILPCDNKNNFNQYCSFYTLDK